MVFVINQILAYVKMLGQVQHVINALSHQVVKMEIAMGLRTHVIVLKAGQDICVPNLFVLLVVINLMPSVLKYDLANNTFNVIARGKSC